MSDTPVVPLPPSYDWGFVVGRSISAMADTIEDSDRLPEARGSNGRVTFTPFTRYKKELSAPTAFVQFEVITAKIVNGNIVDAHGSEGIYLISGAYKVAFTIDSGSIPGFDILVTPDHTTENPLDLVTVSPYVPEVGTPVVNALIPPGAAEDQVIAWRNGRLVWVNGAVQAEAAADRAEAAATAAEEWKPEFTWSGTNLVIDGVTGPNLKGEKGAEWSMGWVGEESLDNILTPGTYRQHLSAPATVANGYPGEGMTGILEVIPTHSTSVIQRYTRNTSPFEVYTRFVGANPRPWVMMPSPVPQQLTGSDHLDTLVTAKTYFLNLPVYATTDRGYPENGVPGLLEVIRAHHSSEWALQRYTEYVPNQAPERIWMRTVAPAPSAWVQYAPGGGGEVDMAEVDQRIHALAQPRTTWQDDVQGVYQRTNYSSFTAMATDPRKPDRVWGRTSQIGYADSNGTGPLTLVGAVPADAGQAIMFTDSHVFYVAGLGSRVGTVWRSPLPDLTAPSLTWTKVFDLTDQSGGAGAYFREQSLAISQSGEALILEYGGVVTGGPSVYHCPDIHAATPVWTKSHTFAEAKHGHGVVWLNGRWWAMNGDANFPDAGLWTSADGTTWERATPAWDAETNRRYGINIHAVSVGGLDLILTDSDTREHESVLYWPTTEWDGVTRRLRELITCPAPYNEGTVRSLTQTSEGNLIWMQIGESGSLGPTDSLWISRGPDFTNAVLLEEWPSPHSLGTLGAPVESGEFVFFGRARVRKEKFIGQ